jgi:hypothetical protein
LIDYASRIAGIAIERDRSQTALTRAFEKIEKSEGQLRQIVDAIPQMIVVLNPDGTPVYANQTILDYTGLALEKVMAPDFRVRAFHSEDIARLRPGVVNTPMNPAETHEFLKQLSPMKRLAEVGEVVDLLLYLESAQWKMLLEIDKGGKAAWYRLPDHSGPFWWLSPSTTHRGRIQSGWPGLTRSRHTR